MPPIQGAKSVGPSLFFRPLFKLQWPILQPASFLLATAFLPAIVRALFSQPRGRGVEASAAADLRRPPKRIARNRAKQGGVRDD